MLKQYTLVARAAADDSKKYGKSICSAGISPSDGLIRVYPLLPSHRMKAWDTYEVDVEQRKSDTRKESWHANTTHVPRRVGSQDRYRCIGVIAKNNLAPSIGRLNDERKSLAVVIPDCITGLSFDTRAEAGQGWGKRAVHEVPRVTYELGGKRHRHQILEMGCYEWLRNGRNSPSKMWDNLRFTDGSYRHMFLVGNMAKHRNSWMIIAVLPLNLNKWNRVCESALPTQRLKMQTGFNTCRYI